MAEVRTVVTFQSEAFNTSETKSYYINPYRFGDDVARWISSEFQQRNIEVGEEVGEEDFGWYLTFQLNGIEYSFVLGWREGDETEPDVWLGWLERDAGFVASLFGGRKKNIASEAAVAIHEILSQTDKVHDVRWHLRQDFDANNEENWTHQPL